jgi:hypothetical protein
MVVGGLRFVCRDKRNRARATVCGYRRAHVASYSRNRGVMSRLIAPVARLAYFLRALRWCTVQLGWGE